MKTACVLPFAALAVAAVAAHPTHRQLQNFPPSNGQGQFRPGPMRPNGGLQPQFGNVPMQGNGLGQFPVNGQMMPNAPNVGAGVAPTLGTANTQVLGVGAGEADVAGTGSAAGANAASSSPSADVAPSPGTDAAGAAATTTDPAQAEPTIMVIIPDSLGAHSGWSSFSSDVGETTTKPPSTEKPAEADKPAETSAALKASSTTPALTLLTTAFSIATAFGLSLGGNAPHECVLHEAAV